MTAPESPHTENVPQRRALEAISKIFGIDLRALGALRIGAGALILVDLCQRLGDLTAFYSDAGTMPRTLLIERVTASPWCASFHLLSGEPSIEAVLLLVAVVCAAPLILGFRTRLFTVLSWIFLTSLHYRNPIILQGGDVLLRLILFWGIFLPWGERFSVDGRVPRAGSRPPVISAASAAFLLQLAFVYWFSAWLKSGPAWRHDFTAVYAAFSLDHFARPLGKFLLPFHGTLRVLTVMSFWIEAAGPMAALFGGIFTWQIRFAAVLAFIGFHAAMGLCLDLGLFPWICSVAWLAFLPPPFWDLLERHCFAWGEKVQNWRLPRLAVLRRVGRSSASAKNTVTQPCERRLAWSQWDLPWRKRALIAENAAASMFLIYVILWNLRTVVPDRMEKWLPHKSDFVGWLSGTAQVWDMFSPAPLMEGGWFVMPAQLRNGSEVDIFRRGGRVSWEKPTLVSSMYKNDRWRKYLVLIAAASNTNLRPALAEYLRSNWNATHSKDQEIASLKMILMEQDTLPERGYTAPRPIVLWSGEWKM